MNFEYYEREQEAADVSNYQDSLARTKPVTLAKVKNLNPVSILEKYLLIWPPCDVRWRCPIRPTMTSRSRIANSWMTWLTA